MAYDPTLILVVYKDSVLFCSVLLRRSGIFYLLPSEFCDILSFLWLILNYSELSYQVESSFSRKLTQIYKEFLFCDKETFVLAISVCVLSLLKQTKFFKGDYPYRYVC